RLYLPQALHAADAGPTPEVNAINTVWTLLAAFLVFCMQVGFVMLEAGFARSRESINILVEGIVDTCICGVTFWAWGFAFMFMDGNGFIGLHGWFLKGIPDTYLTTGGPMLPHNIILGAVGGLILWFGWYGFNPGSTLSAMDVQGIARVSFNTTMAACSAGLAALFYGYVKSGTWDLSYTTNGFLAGLVAITCPCYWVSPTGAFLIGLISAVVLILAIDLLEY